MSCVAPPRDAPCSTPLGAGEGAGALSMYESREKMLLDVVGLTHGRADRVKSILALHPEWLWTVVKYEPMCCCVVVDCACESCKSESVTWLSALLEARALTEGMLRDVAAQGVKRLDWKRLSRETRLSPVALLEHADEVDWAHVSAKYELSERFVRVVHARLDWSKIGRHPSFAADRDALWRLTVVDRIVPLAEAVAHRVVPLNSPDLLPMLRAHGMTPALGEAIVHAGAAAPRHLDALCQNLEAELGVGIGADQLVAAMSQRATALLQNCVRAQYIPQNAGLVRVLCCGAARSSWLEFVRTCKPDESFLERHVLGGREGCDEAVWRAISAATDPPLSDAFCERHAAHVSWPDLLRARPWPEDVVARHLVAHSGDPVIVEAVSQCQRLTPEFIDQHAALLDWWLVCEHQYLPEWLLRKHVGRLNWGQVSWYQVLSPQFVHDFNNRLNHIKLSDPVISKRTRRMKPPAPQEVLTS